MAHENPVLVVFRGPVPEQVERGTKGELANPVSP